MKSFYIFLIIFFCSQVIFGQSLVERPAFVMSSVESLKSTNSLSSPVSINSSADCLDVKSGLSLLNAPLGTGLFNANCNVNLKFNELYLQLYPNPVHSYAKIKIKNLPINVNSEFLVSVYSSDGAMLLFSFKKPLIDLVNGFEYDFSRLNPGVYILQIYSSKYIDNLKFIKIS